MASLILGAAGSAIGGSFGGFTLFGATINGAQIGGAIGASLGMQIDAALSPAIKRQGPRLSDVALQSSSEGAAIPRVFGRMRLAGQLIWASRFKESASVEHTGGKGMPSPGVATTAYAYSISFAVGLCEGPISRIGRVWADGNLLDTTRYTMRVHTGGESQTPDPVIEEIEGAGNTPAYRGLAYVVFEDMPLAEFGNRIPQLAFEVVRSLSDGNPEALENRLSAVALIPGAGEFVYAPAIVSEDDGKGRTAPLNSHNASGISDTAASLDELQALAPNLKSVSLVVGWFGDDLRAGAICIRPGVEESVRHTYPGSWSVNGIARAGAYVVSRNGERPAYGGTPSDDCVKAAIADLKLRGLAVTFYPFVFMDIPAGNTLPNPYSGNAAAQGQSAHPWRGRITASPAAGFVGSVDQTAAAGTQVNAFFTSEWGYRRMVLHYARLCAEAGGVDSFLIGSELVALTRTRSDASTYPAVAALKQLAADVRVILPGAKIGYAADWTEYACHQTGAGTLRYPLDALWSDPNIDFVGIDNYMPLADWRDGGLDAAEFASTYDPAYLAANIRGGEGYDWYYASEADRTAQHRTAITDGLGKPWVWRFKDIWSWWSNAHYERPAGSEAPSPTAWVPQSKPIRFTELGCPAVDKGANQPNVFHDPKSSESFFPYFSKGTRDDLIQRRFLEAHLSYWRDPANNPVSTLYHGPMLDTDRLAVWCWDARPYPFFPSREDVWGDAENYTTGHWLNGRLGDVPLSNLVATLAGTYAPCDVSGLSGLVTGYAVTDIMSVRDALGPLMTAYGFDAVESEGVIRFVSRGSITPVPLDEENVVLGDGTAFTLERAQETDLPNVSAISYCDAADYRDAVVQSRRLVSQSERVARSALPLVLEAATASAIGDRLLQDAWVMREQARFSLPPSQLALDPADEIAFTTGGRTHRLRLTQIHDGLAREMECVATDPSIYENLPGTPRTATPVTTLRQPGRALLTFLDLPLLSEAQNPDAPLVAAYADPWPGRVDLYKDGMLTAQLGTAATLGETVQDFWSGPLNRWDTVNALTVELYSGTLSSVDDTAVFAGANALAVQNPQGEWEIVQFARAELLAPRTWCLSRLLRGQRGSEQAMANPVPAGARVVILNKALAQPALTPADALLPHTYIYGPAGKPLGDPAFQSETRSFAANGRRPLAPCHVRLAWNGGDLTLAWKRRDRAPAASRLDLAETPLSDPLSFDLEILSGATVIRTASVLSQSSFVYTAAMQATDFPGGLPDPLTVRLYQRSSVLGRGRPKTETLHVR